MIMVNLLVIESESAEVVNALICFKKKILPTLFKNFNVFIKIF